MRNWTWITLIAMAAVACNNNGNDDSDTDSGDTDTGPEVVQTFTGGTATYTVKIDSTTVCSSSYSLTGEEVASVCPDCDFAFKSTATETANTDTQACPDRNPWRYTFSVPYPARYPDDEPGFGFLADGTVYLPAYAFDLPAADMFFSFYLYEGDIYRVGLLTGSLYPDDPEPVALPGTFTNTDGTVAWTYNPDVFNSPSAAFIRNCTDNKALGNDIEDGDVLGAVATIPQSGAGNVILNTDTVNTVSSTVNCTEGEYADSWTLTVAAAGDVKLTVDTANAAAPMDAYMYVNDSDGCTIAVADDQFECTSGVCTDGDTDTSNDYDCCPSVTLEALAVGTYTVYVQGHPTGDGSCTATDNMAAYDLKAVGATAVAAGDELHPTYEIDATGGGTVGEE